MGRGISYSNGGSIYVLDVATGSAKRVAKGGTAEWFDDHTLVVQAQAASAVADEGDVK